MLTVWLRYAAEVDVDFVRKAVRSIGRLAIKIESTADRCIKVLLSLIQTKVNYVVQEAVVVIKDIFRKYPNRYESIIATLCENLDSLDEPEARAARTATSFSRTSCTLSQKNRSRCVLRAAALDTSG
jgi:vesicle coat complex subunit